MSDGISGRASLTWGRIAQLWQLAFRGASFDCPDPAVAVSVFAGGGGDRRLEQAEALALLEMGRCEYDPLSSKVLCVGRE